MASLSNPTALMKTAAAAVTAGGLRAPMPGAAPGAGALAVGPANPQMQTPEDQWMQLNISKEDIDQTVEIVTLYRGQWAANRLGLMRTWMRSNFFYRGIQVIDWFENAAGGGSWVDSLAWYSGSDKVKDGESTGLERFQHPLTLMLGTTFVANMSREVPLSVVKPEDARVLADLETAEEAETAIAIVQRRNRARQMTRGKFELLYLYGAYGEYTRATVDPEWGFDTALDIAQIEIDVPARLRCMGCGRETPVAEMPPAGSASSAALPACPGCGAGLGPESYYPAEPTRMALGVAGIRKVPRAMVRQTIHSPLELDADPQAKTLAGTPILAFDMEIDIGEARQMFPAAWDRIQEGAATSTSPNADYERLRRNESNSIGTGYTSDSEQQRPTYSQVWVQPMAYSRKGDKEYAARMAKAAPDGLKLTMLGAEVVGVKRAVLTREWSWGRLRDNCGLYPQAIAENVVSFNERFNNAMALYDDYMQRAAPGLNLVDAAMIDTDKWKGNNLAPATVVPVPTKFGALQKTLAEAFLHFDIPINPALALYPQMLWTFAQLLNGLPVQLAGAGTNEDVETYGGQNLQQGQAQLCLTPYWENVKVEQAEADRNAIECLQGLMGSGAVGEIWETVRDAASGYRNNSVNPARMRGRVLVDPDEEQAIPLLPDELYKNFNTLMAELTQGNPAAQRIFDVPANQETIGKALYPGVVSPVAAQRLQTLKDLNTLMEAGAKGQAEPMMRPDGSVGMKLPVEPSIVWDYGIVIPTLGEYMIENAELRIKNPMGWSYCEQYLGACQEMQAQQGMRKAALELKVKAAGAPPPQGPDPAAQAELRELIQAAQQAIPLLLKIGAMDPALTKSTETAQVQALKEIVDTTVDAAKLAAGGK
jgi:hypothetical protein